MARILLCLVTVILCACSSVPIKVNPPLDLTKRVIGRPKVALVLGGGGARGFAHLGVIKALTEAHIPINLIVGTSAGSLIGSLYAVNPDIDAVIAMMMKSSYLDYIDVSLRTMMSGPVLGTQLQQFIARNTYNCRLEKTRIPFISVATDINSGKTVAISRGCLPVAVNASCAVPTILRPVVCGDLVLVDGGVVDPLPVDIAKRYNPDIIIAVNISSDIKPFSNLNVSNIVSQTINIMMWTLTRYNLNEANVVIRPNVGNVGMFDLSNKQQIYQAGLIAGRKAIPRIKALLQQS
jgi:NTE family protein